MDTISEVLPSLSPHSSVMAWLFYRCWMCRFGYQLYYLYLLYFILCTAKGQWFAAGYESKILFCLKHSWEERSDDLCSCLYKWDKKNYFHVPACCTPIPSCSRKNAFPASTLKSDFQTPNLVIQTSVSAKCFITWSGMLSQALLLTLPMFSQLGSRKTSSQRSPKTVSCMKKLRSFLHAGALGKKLNGE